MTTTVAKPSDNPTAALRRPVPLVKQPSEGTLKLNTLRRRLEDLEAKKAHMLLQEENERKRLREIVNERYDALRKSIDQRLGELQNGLEKLSDAAASPSNAENTVGDELGEPSSGRDAALALGWIQRGCKDAGITKESARKRIQHERAFLERQGLAAKVMANVSLQQKKLLNLTYSWLRTFMPHCLAKINRVSFGLLTEEDCEAVLREDPMVPRSRLKLAVPFVGKDVPSSSSEFAHPDIIIGLTILAYRYSGLRRSDFNDVVDALTADFTREIGPARERPSSRKHEMWVLEAGGRLRGIKSTTKQNDMRKRISNSSADTSIIKASSSATDSEEKDNTDEDPDFGEVVQLKFLSKSNAEQMEKLFALWRTEPHVVHHYLGRFIFPAYMRHQRSKISASGQAVGGDMLFGRRVGFSGTPSDLLPRELGKCSYETGDDGKMLSTVLDKEVTSYEHLPSDWSVEGLLDMIAQSKSPRYHALIDTGALITGYSNQQVAEELLKRGLADWCDGVVFLDENDTKKVLVKDTGRVVPADQCGVPLERRFAFYDQIHTTGMDIQHVVNAVAALTLGKDMVFRDFVQGAYRMRGIGVGQTVRVFIIPEVKNLIERELKAAGDLPVLVPKGEDPVLTEIVAWLVINSMRSEMTQWSMLCLQNITNVFRKNAFRQVLDQGWEDAKNVLGYMMQQQNRGDDKALVTLPKDSLQFRQALSVFDEPIDFTLDSTVPDPVPFSQKLREQLEMHSDYIETPEQRNVAELVLEEVAKYSVTDGRTMERLDSEQEREQEQEQEKEIRSKREQEIEIEKFVDREYTRSDEAQRSWHISNLMEPPKPHEDGEAYGSGGGHPFFPLREFKLRYGEPLKYPDFLGASRNYFNPTWTGLRRVKNVVMVLEYAPEPSKLSLRSPELTFKDSVLDEEKSLQSYYKAFTLFSSTNASLSASSTLGLPELQAAIRAAADVILEDAQVQRLLDDFGNGKEVDREGLKRILTSGRVREVEEGRFFVALSLAEAETVRRIIHMQRDGEGLLASSSGNAKIKQSNVQCALRYIPMQTLGAGQQEKSELMTAVDASKTCGLVFDASRGWRIGTEPHTGVSPYQRLASHASFRFLDCAQHYNEHALNVLVRCLQRDHVHTRELFFQSTIGARRRLERKWQETPLAKVFTMANEWALLKHHAQAVFIRKALSQRGLTLWEAFTAFDFDDNGVLTPAEFFGAMRFLGLPDVTPDDVVDMVEAADRNDDGVIDYREYLDMLKEGGALEEGDLDDDDDESEPDDQPDAAAGGDDEEGASKDKIKRKLPPKVEPFGADQLREIITARRRETSVRQRKDRARRQAYQQALDIKVFEAELRASKDRKGGSNPTVIPSAPTAPEKKTTTIFRFNGNDAPIRMVPSGKWKFSALRNYHSVNKKPEMKCSEGHVLVVDQRYWDDCVVCSRRQTKWRCNECQGYNVCSRCYQRSVEEMRKKAEDITDKITYAQIFGGCSFSLQVPAAAVGLQTVVEDDDAVVAAVATNPSSSDQVSPEELAQAAEEEEAGVAPSAKEETSTDLFEVKSEAFAVTMEIRFERLPPKGHTAALLRFFPSTYGRSRSRHLSSAYLTHRGRVVFNTKMNEVEPDVWPEGEPAPAVLTPNVWHTVTVVANAQQGTFHAYVDGELSSKVDGIDNESLTLRHQLVVFGGGKQAQARGGHIHRLLIHDSALTPEECKKVAAESKSTLNTHVVWYVSPGAQPGNVRQEIMDAGFTVTMCDSVAQALAAIKSQTKCFVATLSDEPIPFAEWSVDDDIERPPTSQEGEVGEQDEEVLKIKQASKATEKSITSFVTLIKMVRAMTPTIACIGDASCMTSKLSFKLGERIAARYRQGSTWYNGRIARVFDNDTYDINYDDGDHESAVSPDYIRSLTASRVSHSQLQVRDKAKSLDAQATNNDAELRDAVFVCEVEYLRRSAMLDKA